MSSANQEHIRRRNDPRDQSVLRKSEQTRLSILDEALKFLWTRPFRELTVGGLMGAVGASRPAFYQYFSDLHDLMETLLHELQREILAAAAPWFEGEGDAVLLLESALRGLVEVCSKHGPVIRAVVEAAPMDERLEGAWTEFLGVFDDAVAKRIETMQAGGLIKPFAARPVAVALNRMDVGVMIHHFGRQPGGDHDEVYQAVRQIWVATLYGSI